MTTHAYCLSETEGQRVFIPILQPSCLKWWTANLTKLQSLEIYESKTQLLILFIPQLQHNCSINSQITVCSPRRNLSHLNSSHSPLYQYWLISLYPRHLHRRFTTLYFRKRSKLSHKPSLQSHKICSETCCHDNDPTTEEDNIIECSSSGQCLDSSDHD